MKKNILIFVAFLLITTITEGQSTLVGMTAWGSSQSNAKGTIFSLTTGDTIISKQYNFLATGYNAYGELCQAPNGKLYGMTYKGGTNNLGVLFEYEIPTNNYVTLIDFDGFNKGSYPRGSLVLSSNGKMYGMTTYGGSNNSGILFEFDPSISSLTKKFDFTGSVNGKNPQGSLIQASNGKLYGMTNLGGINNKGVLFEYDYTTNIYVKKIDFAGSSNGEAPIGSLMQGANGKIYGMTSLGGINNKGLVFEYNYSSNALIKRHDFTGFIYSDGSFPKGSLLQASDGKLYGLTSTGGNSDAGTIFQYNPSDSTYGKEFDFSGTTTGSNPFGSLLQASNGKFYGMTNMGGANGEGVLFEFNPIDSTFINRFDFDVNSNEGFPYGSLIKDTNGKLYGMTNGGGTNYPGILFEFNPTTLAFIKKLDFSITAVGSSPKGSLIHALNGKFYGMTEFGGANDLGVIFEYDIITNSVIRIFDFDGLNGQQPTGSLLQAANGKLYGMTPLGGINNFGVLFEYDPTNLSFTKIHDFGVTIDGGGPNGSLMQASNGKLYGLTIRDSAGINGGTLFEYDISISTFTTKYIFSSANNWNMGKAPYGSLIEVSNGKLFGMTAGGGLSFSGVIFEYNFLTNTYTKKFDFYAPGCMPKGSLLKATNGLLYGMTEFSGSTGGSGIGPGIIFSFNPLNNVLTKIHDFVCDGSPQSGWSPRGSLIQASNGKLYGMCSYTASIWTHCDKLFEYDINSNTYRNNIDFNSNLDKGYGSHPYGDLLEYGVTSGAGISNSKLNAKIDIFPNPTGGIVTINLNWQSTKNTYQLAVYNLIGEQVYSSKNIQLNIAKIDLSNQPSGIYFIKIKTEEGEISKKIIVNR